MYTCLCISILVCMCICDVCGVYVLSVCMCVCWLSICVYLRINPCVHTYAHIHVCAHIYLCTCVYEHLMLGQAWHMHNPTLGQQANIDPTVAHP